MVLCKYFQQGSCRFGTKCNNEHFDVKQIVKTDVESAFNGKQWPFSCYGPFKDRPCVPNFIDDQSFEEVRCRFHEAQQKNIFEQYHQQFSMDMTLATNKMKALLQLTPEIVEVITQLYDTSSDKKTNNPFGLSSNQTNPASNSIFNFNKPVANTGTGNIFGGFSSGATAGSVFGAGGGGDGDASNTTVANNIYGGSNNNQSIFGQTVARPINNAFGNVPTQPPALGANNSNVFAPSTQTTNIFIQNAQQFPQQQLLQQQPQQSSSGTNIFAQAAQQLQSQNLQNQAQVQPPQAGFFPQTMQTPSQNLPSQQAQPLLSTPGQPNNITGTLTYSRMEDLTSEEIEAFKGDAFLPGQIPCVPPPRELIN